MNKISSPGVSDSKKEMPVCHKARYLYIQEGVCLNFGISDIAHCWYVPWNYFLENQKVILQIFLKNNCPVTSGIGVWALCFFHILFRGKTIID